MNRALVFDTETTGLLKPEGSDLKEQPLIIEFAIKEIVYSSSTKPKLSGREYVWLINPGVQISEEITKITGLTNDDLDGKPSFGKVYPEIADAFVGVHCLIAHNLPFDLGMLVNDLRRINKHKAFPYPPRQLCTVSEFIHVKGRRMKLIELYQHVVGKPLAQTHRAMDDVDALVEIVLGSGLLEGGALRAAATSKV